MMQVIHKICRWCFPDKSQKYLKTARDLGGNGLKKGKYHYLGIAVSVAKSLAKEGRPYPLSGKQEKWHYVPYDEQIAAAAAMLDGYSPQVNTGEGKTLIIALYAASQAMAKRKVHIVTANSYLAHRDAEWMSVFYSALGLTCTALPETGAILTETAKDAYASQIIYGTAAGFGFDYLRDRGMTVKKSEACMGDLDICIVDEADSVLIDDAVNPLIIGGEENHFPPKLFGILNSSIVSIVQAQEKSRTEYMHEMESPDLPKEEKVARIWLLKHSALNDKRIDTYLKLHPEIGVAYEKYLERAAVNLHDKKQELKEELYFYVDNDTQTVEFTNKGQKFINKDENAFTPKGDGSQQDYIKIVAIYILQALLNAHVLKKRDVDYIVRNGEVVLLDLNTGRPMEGRKWSEGLHQAVQAKEGMEISASEKVFAKITLQSFFAKYTQVLGLSGTLCDAADELAEIYKLKVIKIPPHKPLLRTDHPDKLFIKDEDKYAYICNLAQELKKVGRPLLIGGSNIAQSEELYEYFKERGWQVQLLNANNPEYEASIISNAGNAGTVTIATNMAGRGTDIKIPEHVNCVGGLFVVGLSHDLMRVDNQLRGRCGRQGDNGDTIFLNSFTDKALTLSGGKTLWTKVATAPELEEDSIVYKLLTRIIRQGQIKLEDEARNARRQIWEMDKTLEKLRNGYYAERHSIKHNLHEALEILKEGAEVRVPVKDSQETKENLLQIMAAYWNELLEKLETLEDTSGMSVYMNRKPSIEFAHMVGEVYPVYRKNRWNAILGYLTK